MRYYTLCEFTPSTKGYRRDYKRVWSGAPNAFLFHDNENPLNIEDIRKPLFILSELHHLAEYSETGATASTALAVRVDANTIAATFSMRGFPKPSKVWNRGTSYPSTHLEWLAQNNLNGWYIQSVKDSSVPAVQVNFAEFFDDCHQLPKLMGECPCPLLTTGDCLNTLVWPKLPEVFRDPSVHNSAFDINTKVLNRKRYSTLGDFTFVSSAKTIEDDFVEGLRPWDNHDFSCIDNRSKELSNRGKLRQVNNSTRKQQCSVCTFKRREYVRTKGAFVHKDCGLVESCAGGVSTDQAEFALEQWYEHESGFFDIPGFTRPQRDFLVRLAGASLTVKCVYDSRKTKTIYGGFRRLLGSYVYYMYAAAGRKDQGRAFDSFEALKAALADADRPLGDPPSTLTPLTTQEAIAYAIMASHRYYRKPGGQNHTVRLVSLEPGYVKLETAAGRYIMSRESLDVTGSPREFVIRHPHWQYSSVLAKYRQYSAMRNDKRHLPVITE